jgi:hypothetical protein
VTARHLRDLPVFLRAPRDRPRWPLLLIASPAAVAIWSGWVGLGGLAGFGVVHPLPGIAPGLELNTAITLPVGVEAYAAFALGAWMAPGTPDRARTFAQWSAVGALILGMAGQVAFHLLTAYHAARAPVPVIVAVSCMPVVVLGMGAALAHLLHEPEPAPEPEKSVPAGVPVGWKPDPVARIRTEEKVGQRTAQTIQRRERAAVKAAHNGHGGT